MQPPLKTPWNYSLSRMQWDRKWCTWHSIHMYPHCELQWWPVGFRVQFKVLIITPGALHATEPGYLRNLLSLHVSTCPSRSAKVSTFWIQSSKNQGTIIVVSSQWNVMPQRSVVLSPYWHFAKCKKKLVVFPGLGRGRWSRPSVFLFYGHNGVGVLTGYIFSWFTVYSFHSVVSHSESSRSWRTLKMNEWI